MNTTVITHVGAERSQLLLRTHGFDGLQQLNAVLLNAAVSVGELHKSLAGCSLRLSHADDREDVAKRWRGGLSNTGHIHQTHRLRVSVWISRPVTHLCEFEKAQRKL